MRASGGHLRTIDLISIMAGKPLLRLIRGMARAPFDEGFAGCPLAVCWFVDFACNARCAFCCKAAEIRAGRREFPPLDLAGCRQLLERIRRTVDILYLSGGEPLIHPHIVPILQEARRLKFVSIGMSTNLIELDRRMEVLEYLDAISVSIHSPTPQGQAASLGVSPEQGQRVFDNFQRLLNHPRREHMKVLLNCVIHAGNLDDVPGIVAFARDSGAILELAPANEHGHAPADLAGNPKYEALIDRLLEMRRAGQAPHLGGSSAYYRRIRSFSPFRCFPYGVPNILPDGRLCTPCDVSGQHGVDILAHVSLRSAMRASAGQLGAYPCRLGHCFKAGIVERSQLFGLLLSRQATAAGDEA